MTILEVVPGNRWKEHESLWIEKYRSDGADLTNRRTLPARQDATKDVASDSALSALSTRSYRGVQFHKPSGTWRATFVSEGRHYNLRYHATAEDAARAYDAKARSILGTEAHLNFPNEPPVDLHTATLHKANTSGYRGVTFARGRWHAYIQENKRRRHIGCFATAEDAALARDIKAIELYGDEVVLNFA